MSLRELQSLQLDELIETNGSVVDFSQIRTDGEPIGTLTIDDVQHVIYAPNPTDAVNKHDTCEAFGPNSQAYGSNTIAYTNYSVTNGISCTAGTRAFRIISCDANEKTIKLTSVEGLVASQRCSMRLINNYNLFGNIVSVQKSTNTVTFDKFPKSFRVDECLSDIYLSDDVNYFPNSGFLSAHSSTSHTTSLNEYTGNSDCNSLWVINRPDLGDLSSYAIAAQSEGYQCNATMQYSHAEGINTTAAGKYSHAEGMNTIASYAAHSEGTATSAVGNSSHSEGYGTLANGMNSHAEGIFTQATGYGSHADGLYSVASSSNSYVWNGLYQSYSDHGTGTFNINPANTISGFYIGNQNLNDIINSYVQPAMKYIKDLVYGKMFDMIAPILSTEKIFTDMNVGILSGVYINWTNNILDVASDYCVLSGAVEPGDRIFVDKLNCGWYAGIACRNERGQRVFAWDPSDYVQRRSDKKILYFGSKDIPSDITREVLDAATVDDDYYWYRTAIANTGKLGKSGNSVELTMPDGARYIYISTSNIKYNADGSIKPNTMPIIKRFSQVVADSTKDVYEILDGMSKTIDEILK